MRPNKVTSALGVRNEELNNKSIALQCKPTLFTIHYSLFTSIKRNF